MSFRALLSVMVVALVSSGLTASALEVGRFSAAMQPGMEPAALMELGARVVDPNNSTAPAQPAAPASPTTQPPAGAAAPAPAAAATQGSNSSNTPATTPPAASPAPNSTNPAPSATAGANASVPVENSTAPAAPVNGTVPAPSGNSTAGNSPAAPANGTVPVPAPAGNNTAVTNASTPSASNDTASNGTTTANGTASSNNTAPVANSTAPVANSTAPAANSTAPASNGTAPASNGTAPVNGTTPANSTGATNGTAANTTAPVSAAPVRGPTAACPSCQPTTGAPRVTVERTPEKISLNTASVTLRVESLNGVPRFVIASTADKTESKHVLSLERMFVTSAVGLIKGSVPADQRFKEVVFKAAANTPAPYSWSVGQAATASDNAVTMYSFPLTGSPTTLGQNTGALRPTIIFDNTFLSDETTTTNKYDFKVDNFDDTYWQGPGNSLYNNFVTVFHVQRQDRVGMEENPQVDTRLLTTMPVNVTIPARPVVGVQNRGSRSETLPSISAGGLDLAAVPVATSASGNERKVTMLMGKDVDGSQAVYVFYERFDKAIVHDPYLSINSRALTSASAGVGASVAVAIAFAATIIAFFF